MTTVGLCLPQLGEHVDRAVVKDFTEQAEELGFRSLWVQEHLFYPLRPRSGYSGVPRQPIPAPYRSTLAATEMLAAAAAWTERVDVGTSVLVTGYHHPVELGQRLATLDLLSQGRLIAGISVGWSRDEHDLMGVDSRTRGRRCTEFVRALLACWGPDPVEFDGEFFTIPESVIRPKPVQAPRPRLMSGMRSPDGLARTAELFDIWNPSRGSAAEIARALAAMHAIRPPGMPQLRVYQRLFVQQPVLGLEDRPGLEGLMLRIAAACTAGFDSVIVDANFWSAIATPDDWATLPGLIYKACASSGLPPSES